MKHIQKSMFGMTGDDSLVFVTKLLLCSFSICYCLMDNHSKPIQGLGQANGASPAIWAIVSSPILDLVCNTGYGIKLMSSISKSNVKTVGNGFVDDMDLMAANDTKAHSSPTISQSVQEGLD